jgi:ABC-type bacteriocin/lantibiotic exporter with double-glycine peptidase domain
LAGKSHTVESLKQLTKTSASGTTMLNLKQAAERLDFHVEARKGNWRALSEHLQHPGHYAILHTIRDRRGHFVALVGALNEKSVRVADVVRGVQDLDERSFFENYVWEGSMLLLSTADSSRRR